MDLTIKRKVIVFIAFTSIIQLAFFGNIQAQETLKVMSWNIRLDTPHDGKFAWDFRKEKFVAFLKEQKADLAGFQEVLHNQLTYTADHLTEYSWFGVGRTDGKMAGEYSPVFFKTERFDFLQGGNFWLSEEPETAGSKGWDAAYERIVSWVQLFDKNSGDTLWFFNTHFDHIGEEARKNSALLILSKINELTNGQTTILTGDLNVKPDNEAYKMMSNPPSLLFDSRKIAFGSKMYEQDTFTGFDDDPSNDSLIDYIFHTQTLQPHSYEVFLPNTDGFYLSDHLPVVTVFNLDTK
jgi:endonuclease/exonuclease/phosphatase family metal-dependent hydrolase